MEEQLLLDVYFNMLIRFGFF